MEIIPKFNVKMRNLCVVIKKTILHHHLFFFRVISEAY